MSVPNRGSVTAAFIGLATAVAAAFAALLAAAAFAGPKNARKADLLWLYPNLVRLLVSLSGDRRVARPVRCRLLVAVAYNTQPINLIPDFVPVIGLADNLVVAAWAVRSAIRRSGPEVVLSHWHGNPASFSVVCRLCRLDAQPAGAEPEPASAREEAGGRVPSSAGGRNSRGH